MICQHPDCPNVATVFTKVWHTRGSIKYYAECVACYRHSLEEEIRFETEEEFLTDQLKSKL